MQYLDVVFLLLPCSAKFSEWKWDLILNKVILKNDESDIYGIHIFEMRMKELMNKRPSQLCVAKRKPEKFRLKQDLNS